MNEAKASLRLRMRRLRASIDPAWAARAGAAASAAVAALPPLARAASVGLYRPLPGEVPVDVLEAVLRASGRRLLLPAWDPEKAAYAWAIWDEGSPLEAGPFGVPQPARTAGPAQGPDVAVVPGLAFDRAGRRLGHGGGHFDRLLADAAALRIGLAFAQQIVERVPAGPGDARMDWVGTEEETFSTENRKPEREEAPCSWT